MKKTIILFISIILITSKSFAQASAGSLAIGGVFNLGFSGSKNKGDNVTVDGPKTTTFIFIPNAEYYLLNDLSLGAGIGYGIVRTKTPGAAGSGTISSEGMFHFVPFARKYFSLGDKFSFFGEAEFELGLGNSMTENTSGNSNKTTYSHTIINIGVMPGFSYSVSGKVALEATFGFIGYMHDSQEVEANTTQSKNGFSFDFNMSSLNFGIKYFLK